MSTYVYELTDPRCSSEPQPGEYVYVGATDKPIIRLISHVKEAAKFGKLLSVDDVADDKRLRWLLTLHQEGLPPAIRIRETLETREAGLKRETYWIHRYQARGCIVLNDRKRNHILDDDADELALWGPLWENFFVKGYLCGEPD